MGECCKTSEKHIRCKQYTPGYFSYLLCCSYCGKIEKRLSKAEINNIQDIASIKDFDDEEYAKNREYERQKRIAEWQEKARIEREAQDREWLAWYNQYLESEEWQQKRSMVLKRANWICEGCGKNRANQVHHLTYERVGHEMLFDLVAICKDCHESIPSKFRRTP